MPPKPAPPKPVPPRPARKQRAPPPDRDVNKLNTHIKVRYTDTLAEPNGTHSLGCIWDFASIAYACCRDLHYCLLSTFLGVWIAGLWGCQFGCVAFEHVWFISPFMKIIKITCKEAFQKCCHMTCRCCIYPWTRACSYFCVAFKSDDVDYDAIDNPPVYQRVKQVRIIQDEPVEVVVVPGVKTDNEQLTNMFLGDKEKMRRSVNRQLML
ncbi:caveolin-3-like [Mizuhopecten yessoensis]|uniref:Caveolin n=1 Tax=Mizuhopecten yessoensis TaxID=6573 RepID=A0A210R1H2_MIZYE|nr:caveolin-3-like [Mizuhopecten yessoensis]OWF54816.1 Caveolin-1 [Mizuhopecten yessoensis]